MSLHPFTMPFWSQPLPNPSISFATFDWNPTSPLKLRLPNFRFQSAGLQQCLMRLEGRCGRTPRKDGAAVQASYQKQSGKPTQWTVGVKSWLDTWCKWILPIATREKMSSDSRVLALLMTSPTITINSYHHAVGNDLPKISTFTRSFRKNLKHWGNWNFDIPISIEFFWECY